MKITFPLAISTPTISWHTQGYKKLILTDFIIEALVNGKSIAFVSNDKSQFSGLDEFIENNLSNGSIDLEDFFTSISYIEKTCAEILKHTSVSTSNLFGAQGFWDLVKLYNSNTSAKSFAHLSHRMKGINIDFTPEVYKEFKMNLHAASQLFSSSLNYQLSKSDIVFSSFIKQDNEDKLVSFKYLESFVRQAKDISNTLNDFFERYRRLRSEDFNLKLADLKAKVGLWKEMKNGFGFKPNASLIEEIQSLLIDTKTLCGDKSAEENEISIQSIEENIHKLSHRFEMKLNQECKVLNVRNLLDESISTVHMGVEKLIKDINNCKLFKEEISINSLSLSLTKIAIDDLILKLENGLFELRSGGELPLWFDFRNNLSGQSKALIDAIIELPKERWQAEYDSWFLEELLFQNGLTVQENLFEHLESLQDKWDTIRFNVGDICQSLMRSKNTSIAFYSYNEAMAKSEEFQYAVLLDNIKADVLSEFRSNFEKVLGLKPKKISGIDDDMLLHESMINSLEIEDELEQKLLKSKLLATYFVEDSPHVQLYVTSQSNIIIDSLYADLSEILADKIKEAKHIKMRDNAFKVFTEFFLNDASINYYFYDQSALRFKDEADIYRFSSKVKALQYAGYYTVAIDRFQLQNPSYINTLLENQNASIDA